MTDVPSGMWSRLSAALVTHGDHLALANQLLLRLVVEAIDDDVVLYGALRVDGGLEGREVGHWACLNTSQ